MDLIIFSCKTRLASYFRQKRLQRILLFMLGIVASGFYSWIFSFMLQNTQESEINLTSEKVIGYANLALLAITVLRGFFPAYIARVEIIQRIYPIKPLKKFWVEMVVELASPFYFILLNFLFLLFLMAPSYSFLHLMQSVLVLLTAHVIKRSLQIFVERKMRWSHKHFIASAVFTGAFIALQVRTPMYEPAASWFFLIAHTVAFGFFIAANFFLEQAAAEPRRKVVNYSHNGRRSLSWRLFKNHKPARQLIIFGLAFKVLMLAADAGAFAAKGHHLYDQNKVIWMFMGPLVLYTYVFNNVWGFYKNLWLTTERTTGNYKDFLKAILLPLAIPLLVDAIVSILYAAFFNHENMLFILLMYVTSVLVLTPVGIVASFVSPKVVKGSLMSFGSKTSYLYTFISMTLFAMLFLPMLHPLLYLIYPLLIAGALFALVAVLKEYPKYKYKLFETLYKAED
ncbi:hypothetical protein ACFSKU_19600 [Pontibacter silvestris]|uniref:Uncharacterized protein n=1 Tax=Pontibacter silvestris TaxID=2305183 RepID=A0ABW4X4G6_9BACT|nr:hypothetical protein [Pontibacter silvestris]MCC9134906.1 hypothetical protein [Pontibacter silvestris]